MNATSADLPVPVSVIARAPGRVNLIGDHTDYMGGLAMPMAVQLATTIRAIRGGPSIELGSDQTTGTVHIELPVSDPSAVTPEWGRYVAGVAMELAPLGVRSGLRGQVSSTLPLGSGLSSSAALEVATALALGDVGDAIEIAERCQRAEQRATGVPCGIMDQLAITSAQADHAMVMDCATLQIRHVRVPESARFWVVDSGQRRELVDSAYAERRAQCEQAAALVGPLPTARLDAIESIVDPIVRARGRHVRTECLRVADFAAALEVGDVSLAGALMLASHASLRDDFDVSTDVLDALVTELCSRPGIHGARVTGAGFGGSVVVLADPGVEVPGWLVHASGAATVSVEY